jgi:hypothetical protein
MKEVICMPTKRFYGNYCEVCDFVANAIKYCEARNFDNGQARSYISRELQFYFKIFENIDSYTIEDVRVREYLELDAVLVMIKDDEFDSFPKIYTYRQKEGE